LVKGGSEMARPKSVERSKRVPLGSFRTKLSVDESQLDRNQWNYRWIRDTGARIAQAQAAGYEFVPDDGTIDVGEKEGNTDLGGKISVIGGDDNRKQEGAYRMYLMRQPIAYHKEDQLEKQKRVDAINDQIKRTLKGEKVENAYTPSGSGGSYRP
jgi:hypothetical protein